MAGAHPFRFPDYRAYWVARFCSTIAQTGMVVVIGWQVYDIARRTMGIKEAALQLGLVELAERTFKRPVDVLGRQRVTRGQRRAADHQTRDGGDDGEFAQHRVQPFFSGDSAGDAIESGTGRGVSFRPRTGRITRKKAK